MLSIYTNTNYDKLRKIVKVRLEKIIGKNIKLEIKINLKHIKELIKISVNVIKNLVKDKL